MVDLSGAVETLQMADEAPAGGHDGWTEMVIAIVLSVAGLTTSWSSYQASLWDGDQAAHFSRADALRVMASRAHQEADSRRAVEVDLFNAWLQAKARGDAALATFYEDRFPADLAPAFRAWIAQGPMTNRAAPPSPFVMAAYRPAGYAEAKTLDGQADKTFERGQEDNRISEVFIQGTVFLAMALFFGGIGQVFRIRGVRLALLAISVLACAAGIGTIAALPTLSPG